MKKILLPALALFLGQAAFAQTIFTENFDGASLPAGWAIYNVDNLTPATNVNYVTSAWVVRPNTASGTGNMMVSTSWYTPAGTANDWLVTPSIAIPATGNYTASFQAMASDASYPDGFKVYVSTTGNTVADFSSPALTVAAAGGAFGPYTVDLSAYAGQNVYIAIQNNSNDMFLLFVDDFIVRQPAANDAILEGVSLARYAVTGTNNTLSLSVKNDGGTPITSLNVSWNDGTAHSATISCNIAVGATATVNHTVPVTYGTIVEKNIAVTIDQVNGATDGNPGNNNGSALFNTVSFLADKHVVIEEGTGTWCGWCPRGAVAMEAMVTAHPDDFIGIAVHNGDVMTVTEYDAGAALSGYPGCNVDRVMKDQSVASDLFEQYYQDRKDVLVPAAMGISGSQSGSDMTIEVSAKFFTNFSAANFRLGAIIVEDNVTGTASGYNQTNYYSSTSQNLPLTGAGHNWQTEPNPVPAANMEYDHVGRALLGGYAGQASSVPAIITDGQTVSYTFNYTVPGTSTLADMHVVAVLIDQNTGEIVNASEAKLGSLSIADAKAIEMEVYPNPATEAVNVKFEGNGGTYAITLNDLAGREVAATSVNNASGVQTVAIPVSDLKAGSYLVTIATGTTSYTTQVVVR